MGALDVTITLDPFGPATAIILTDEEIFDGLAYTHRKECAQWVAEAKRKQTRERRVTQTIEMLYAGRSRS